MCLSEEVKSMPSESSLFTNNQEHLRLLNALRESEILRELAALLASSLDLKRILQVLVKRTTQVCGVGRCAVWLLDETQKVFLPATYYISAPYIDERNIQAGEALWYRSSLPFDDPVIGLLSETRVIVLNDLRKEQSPNMRFLAEKFLAWSALLVALVREERFLGMMLLDNPGKVGTFSQELQQLAQAIGQQAAVAIDNAQLYEQAQAERKRAEQLIERVQSIYQVANAVNAGENLSTVLELAIQHLTRSLNADGGAIVLLDGHTVSVASTYQLQFLAPISAITSSLSDLPHCSEAARNKVPHFLTEEHMQDAEKQWYRQLDLENILIVPLIVGSPNAETSSGSAHCIGFAFVNYQHSTRPPSKGQIAFAQDVAVQCALAIEKARILTEARRAAALATERANTLDAVFNAMTEGLIVLDQDGRIVVGNNTASRFLGIPLRAKESHSTFADHHQAYTLQGHLIAEQESLLARGLRGEPIRGEQFVMKRADGEERIIEINVEQLLNSEQKQIGIVSAFRDITAQKRVEQRIRQALETMLHAVEEISGLTDSSNIVHSILVMALKAVHCERGMVQLYDQDQHIFTLSSSFGFSTEAEREWLVEQQHWFALETAEHIRFRTQLLEGHPFAIASEQWPTLPEHTMVLAVPITYNTQLLGVMVLDCSFAPSEKETTSQQHAGTKHSAKKREFTIWEMAIAEGIAQLGGLAMEQARWQREAKTARTSEAAMRESNELQDEFLAIASHEFRSPLTVILSHSQLMARMIKRSGDLALYEKLQEGFTAIEGQARHLTNITNTFLEVTRLNSGQIDLKSEEIDLAEIAQQAVSIHRSTTTAHQLTCRIEPSASSYRVRGDAARMQQIFANLLQNAIKYSPFGGPITVSLRQISQQQRTAMIEVCVEDKGRGIPADDLPHLFERFYRASNIDSSRTKGFGLGLYIVAEVLRLHGGTIRAESSGIVAEGSRFIFTLPRLDEQLDQNER
jgi:PAS domain S-box-containing protein